jgi:hypothetical protein
MVVVAVVRLRSELVVRALPLRDLVVVEQMVALGEATAGPLQLEARGMAPVDLVAETSPTEVVVELDTTAAVEAVAVGASEEEEVVVQVIRSVQHPGL